MVIKFGATVLPFLLLKGAGKVREVRGGERRKEKEEAGDIRATEP